MSIVCVCVGVYREVDECERACCRKQPAEIEKRRRFQLRENWIEKVARQARRSESDAAASQGRGTLLRDGIYFNAIKIDSAKRISQIGLMSFVPFSFSSLSCEASLCHFHMVAWRTLRTEFIRLYIYFRFVFFLVQALAVDTFQRITYSLMTSEPAMAHCVSR